MKAKTGGLVAMLAVAAMIALGAAPVRAAESAKLALPAYNITEVVQRGQPKTVMFVATREGVFPYLCQLHAAHVGGQVIVEPKMRGEH